MPEQRQKTDLEKAREIVSRHIPENIASAVAEGIALGRKEGIALVAPVIDHDGNF